MNCRRLAFALALGLIGCCAPINPTTKQVKAWAATGLPAGSSETQVRRFCAAHGFDYSAGSDWGNAHRKVGGCASRGPVVWMQIAYDNQRRVKSIDVYGGSLEP